MQLIIVLTYTIVICVVCFISESAKSKNKPKATGMDTIMRTARLQQEPPTSTGPSPAKSVGSKYTIIAHGWLVNHIHVHAGGVWELGLQ